MELPPFLTQGEYDEIHITDHRIGLEHIIWCHNQGFTPEMTFERYPTIPLSTIYKIIGFYLDNRNEVDAYVARTDAELEAQRKAAKKGPSLEELQQRMRYRQRLAAREEAQRDKVSAG